MDEKSRGDLIAEIAKEGIAKLRIRPDSAALEQMLTEGKYKEVGIACKNYLEWGQNIPPEDHTLFTDLRDRARKLIFAQFK